ncbi:hypothetical protein B0I31_10564 [Saccharothrix carnea]|uniref:Uncharacterized protein n=1 Tax=Saccharothrix carnea TaxID=1280637 RepID=A0A2P8I9I1_SACCR|nr:hypothetical protein [Saccharothrix carnea]PSL55107.1 hypothetical protein B0I31_10564 [Saccharothrix carnea]
MDEQKLSELFRDAASDAPPPSFDVDAVRSASARATARRRSSVAVGSALALVLVFGGVVVAGVLGSGTSGDHSVAGSAQDASSPNVTPFSAGEPEVLSKDAVPERSGGMPPKSIPDDPSTQGDEPPGSAGRTAAGSAQRGCVEVDRELAVALADELSVANAGQAAPAAADCPPDARGASFLVRAGDVYGTVSVVVVPAGATGLVPDRTDAYASAKTPDGRELYVLSRPEEGSVEPPLADRLAELAERLAARS